MTSVVDLYNYLLDLQANLLDFISDINELADEYEKEMDSVPELDSEIIEDVYIDIRQYFENKTNYSQTKAELDALCYNILNPKNIKNYPMTTQYLANEIRKEFSVGFWQSQDDDNNPFVAYSDAIDKWIRDLEGEIKLFGKKQMRGR